MPKRIDLIGQSFSHLFVLNYVGSDNNGHALWNCKCECGKEKVIPAHKLMQGEVKSCGCMHRKYSHGLTNTRLYHIWRTTKARCLDKNAQKYSSYGGRGISICDEWKDNFQAFYEWAMANGYDDDLTIDRIDANGNYEPSNCRWATSKEQANNRRTNRYIEFEGVVHTISEWSDITGITKSALYHRFSRGWSAEKALTTPMYGSTGR